ncbi:MAG: SAM-dependent methyltransferase [Paludibacteraceae bacterium]|nr:SAM-dependent methyltransferase [Paludibacteraceae bacterium]
MNEATLHFIRMHENDDVHSLMLLASKYPEVNIQAAIRQITGKQKVKHKIPSFYKCNELLYPVKLSLEQSSSEITAKHKSASCEGKVLIDLTGGFGVDSYFFSFHVDNIMYVEKDEELCALAKHNFRALNRKNIEVVNDSAENISEKMDDADWIYLDPARRTKSGNKAVLFSDCEPNVKELAPKLLSKSNRVMIKLSPMIDLTSLTSELPHIAEIQIVAVENECKEVLVILNKSISDDLKIKTTNYPSSGKSENFDFLITDEKKASVQFSLHLKNYLYEPNAAVMKSGAFRLISERFGIDKLHTNSHLYTSDTLIEHFPGRIFKVVKVYDFSKNSLKEFHSDIKKANLTIRNFPVSVSELRKKLKLTEGGDVYIFATTLHDEKKVLVKCEKCPLTHPE